MLLITFDECLSIWMGRREVAREELPKRIKDSIRASGILPMKESGK